MTPARIIIPIEARGQGRPRAVRRGSFAGVHKAEKDRHYEDTLRSVIGAQWGNRPALDGPLRLRILAVYSWPKTKWRKRVPRPPALKPSKPDTTNVAKAAEDAANGILWHDDAQIADSRTATIYGQQGCRPYLVMEVSQITLDDCADMLDLMAGLECEPTEPITRELFTP